MFRSCSLTVVLLLLAILYSASAVVLPRSAKPCPYHIPENADLVEDEYIVMLHRDHSIEQHFKNIGRNLSHEATMFHPIRAINGYRALLDKHTIHNDVRHDPGVLTVHHDHYAEDPEPTFYDGADEETKPRIARRGNMHYFLHWFYSMIMITERGRVKGLNSRDKYRYHQMVNSGEGVDIYILDSGVRITHDAFQGHASHFLDAKVPKYCTSKTVEDLYGHGTHVAGIAGGIYSLAPNSRIISVKVSCGGRYSPESCRVQNGGLAQAVSDVTDAAENRHKKGSVINISAGIPTGSEALRYAIAYATSHGIAVSVAAGNGDTQKVGDPCSFSQYGLVLCVGSVNWNYSKDKFSNFGPLVDLYAPGNRIKSAGIVNDSYWRGSDGTSQASPAVAGFMAAILGYEKNIPNVATVYYRVQQNAQKDELVLPPTSNNRLLNWDLGALAHPVEDPWIGVGDTIGHVKSRLKQAFNLLAGSGTDPAVSSKPEEPKPTITIPSGFVSVGVEPANPNAAEGVSISWTGAAFVDNAEPTPGLAFDDILLESDPGPVAFSTTVESLLRPTLKSIRNTATETELPLPITGPPGSEPPQTTAVGEVPLSPAPAPAPPPPSPPSPPPPPPTEEAPCNFGWCGAPFCTPECGPNGPDRPA